MATFLCDGAATDEEAAALAAVLRCLADEVEHSVSSAEDVVSRWALAGRLEMQGTVVTRGTLRPGWRAPCLGGS